MKYLISTILIVSTQYSWAQKVKIVTETEELTTEVNATSDRQVFTKDGTYDFTSIKSIYLLDENDPKKWRFEELLKLVGSGGVHQEPFQHTDGHHFNVKNNRIIYQKVFKYESTRLEEELLRFLPTTIAQQINNQVSGSIGASFENIDVNYGTYGISSLMEIIAVGGPMSGNISIEVRENRYKVVISNVSWLATGFGLTKQVSIEESFLKKKKGTAQIKNSAVHIKHLKALTQYFNNQFDLGKSKVNQTKEDW